MIGYFRVELLYHEKCMVLHEVPQPGKTPKPQGVSSQLRFCGEQGTPCCTIILYEKVPSFVGWIVTIHHRI
jgi:hypothetical protein